MNGNLKVISKLAPETAAGLWSLPAPPLHLTAASSCNRLVQANGPIRTVLAWHGQPLQRENLTSWSSATLVPEQSQDLPSMHLA